MTLKEACKIAWLELGLLEEDYNRGSVVADRTFDSPEFYRTLPPEQEREVIEALKLKYQFILSMTPEQNEAAATGLLREVQKRVISN